MRAELEVVAGASDKLPEKVLAMPVLPLLSKSLLQLLHLPHPLAVATCHLTFARAALDPRLVRVISHLLAPRAPPTEAALADGSLDTCVTTVGNHRGKAPVVMKRQHEGFLPALAADMFLPPCGTDSRGGWRQSEHDAGARGAPEMT